MSGFQQAFTVEKNRRRSNRHAPPILPFVILAIVVGGIWFAVTHYSTGHAPRYAPLRDVAVPTTTVAGSATAPSGPVLLDTTGGKGGAAQLPFTVNGAFTINLLAPCRTTATVARMSGLESFPVGYAANGATHTSQPGPVGIQLVVTSTCNWALRVTAG